MLFFTLFRKNAAAKMWDHKINIVEISDDDEVFMEINLRVDNNLVHMDSDDDELFTNYPVSGVKDLNWRVGEHIENILTKEELSF